MARIDAFSGLGEFLAVAEHGSFRAAAAALQVTPGAVSQAVRALEARLSLPLFTRTTRRVALTDAGEAFLAQVGPAAAAVQAAHAEAARVRGRPAGHLRLSVPRIAMPLVIEPLLPLLRQRHPALAVDLDVSDQDVDLVARRLDAGIRVGQQVPPGMVAVRLTADTRWLVVGSPAYFAAHGLPRTPADLASHDCLPYLFPTARTVQRWEFLQGRRRVAVVPAGPVSANDMLSLIALVRQGLGLAYTADALVAADLAAGTLQAALVAHTPRTPGLHLYFAAGGQRQPKLRAFIDLARERLGPATGSTSRPPRGG